MGKIEDTAQTSTWLEVVRVKTGSVDMEKPMDNKWKLLTNIKTTICRYWRVTGVKKLKGTEALEAEKHLEEILVYMTFSPESAS